MNPTFLNKYLCSSWFLTQETISCEIIHKARVAANRMDLDMPLDDFRVNLQAQPKLSPTADGLMFQMPGNGNYTIHMEAFKSGINVPITISFSASLKIDRAPNELATNVDISTSVIGNLADWVTDWKDDVESSLQTSLAAYMGFFTSMIYDNRHIPSIPSPKLLFGSQDLGPHGAIDIFLVADGFTGATMSNFRAVANEFVNKLTSETCRVENEPFLSYRNVIRVWSLEVETQTEASHRAVTEFYNGDPEDLHNVPKPNLWKVAPSNLAIIETIGEKVDLVGANVVVFLSNWDGRHNNPRAMGSGNMVLLPVGKNTVNSDTSTLLHELGHTCLGDLADEYDHNGHDIEEEKVYLGSDPQLYNVTSVLSPLKWEKWRHHSLPSWDPHPIKAPQEGAFYFEKGMYRPADNCKMRESGSSNGFCAVCREILTLGIFGNMRTEYLLACSNLGSPLCLKRDGGVPDLVGSLNVNNAPANVHVKLLRGQLPEPWKASFTAWNSPGAVVTPLPDLECEFQGNDGAILKTTIESLCPFAPGYLEPETIILTLVASPRPPLPQPGDIRARPRNTSKRNPYASCSLLGNVVLPPGKTIRFLVELKEQRQAFQNKATHYSDWKLTGQSGANFALLVNLAQGKYKFQACAQDSTGSVSAWSRPCNFDVVKGPDYEP